MLTFDQIARVMIKFQILRGAGGWVGLGKKKTRVIVSMRVNSNRKYDQHVNNVYLNIESGWSLQMLSSFSGANWLSLFQNKKRNTQHSN